MNETQAVERCQNGDLSAFTQLYDDNAKGLYKFIYYKTGHRETAEDITSTSFMKALEKIQSFDITRASFKTWLYQIARNTVIDHYRSFKGTEDIDDMWDLGDNQNLEAEVEIKMKLDQARSYLNELSAEQREIVLLRVWGGYGFKEIAEMTGKTEAASKMMFKRTIEKLRGDLMGLVLLFYFLQ